MKVKVNLHLTHATLDDFKSFFDKVQSRVLRNRLKKKLNLSIKENKFDSFEKSAIATINSWYKFVRVMRYLAVIFSFGLLLLWRGAKNYLRAPAENFAPNAVEELRNKTTEIIVGDINKRISEAPEEQKNAIRREVSHQMQELKKSEGTRATYDRIKQYYKDKLALVTKAELGDSVGKTATGQSVLSWKSGLYGAHYKKLLDASRIREFNDVDFRLESNVDFETTRLHKIGEKDGRAAAILGTTFMTNKAEILNRNKQSGEKGVTTHVMDSGFAAFSIDDSNIQNRLFVAIGDGLGGHTGDENEDNQIARASHFACKHAVRLLSTYDDPDTLLEAIPTIVSEVAEEIRRKTGPNVQSTTLTCAVAFNLGHEMRVIGFSIGDSMLISWDPNKKLMNNILPAKRLDQKAGSGPAHLPTNYDYNNDVEFTDTSLPIGSILIPITDGVYDVFKKSIITQTVGDRTYQLMKMDREDMTTVLSGVDEHSSCEKYVEAIAREVTMRTKMKQKDLLERSKSVVQKINLMTDPSSNPEHSKLEEKRSELNRRYDVLADEQKTLDVNEYQSRRAFLDKIKEELKEETERRKNTFSALQSEAFVADGDDVGILAARFSL